MGSDLNQNDIASKMEAAKQASLRSLGLAGSSTSSVTSATTQNTDNAGRNRNLAAVSSLVKERENKTDLEVDQLDSQGSMEDDESHRLNAKASDEKGDYKAVNQSANYSLD